MSSGPLWPASARPPAAMPSNFRPPCRLKGIVDFDAEVADRDFGHWMSGQQLHGPKVLRSPADR